MNNTHDVIIFLVGLMVGGACVAAVAIKLITYEIKKQKSTEDDICTCEKPEWLDVGDTGKFRFCSRCLKDETSK